MSWITSLFSVALSAAPWLLVGLVLAGIIQAFLSKDWLQRWMGGSSLLNISRAALIGMPLPLCSCGTIPTAMALHRAGAGKAPTTAFMISTPSVGIDSILLSSILLGPIMALARILGAFTCAVSTALLVKQTQRQVPIEPTAASSCGCHKNSSALAPQPLSLGQRLRQGWVYAFGKLLDDISPWVAAGLLLAGILVTWMPADTLSNLSASPWSFLIMAVIGIPLYICATAATPIAAGLILGGMSPGLALVFLLAGPVTSLATLGVFRRELGNRALMAYLVGIMSSSLLLGWALDLCLEWSGLDPVAQASQLQELLPVWIEVLSLLLLSALMLKPLRQRLLGF